MVKLNNKLNAIKANAQFAQDYAQHFDAPYSLRGGKRKI